MFAFSRGELSSFAWETARGVGAARSRPTSGIEDTTWRIRDLPNALREEGQKKEGRTRSGGGGALFYGTDKTGGQQCEGRGVR